MPQHGFTSLSSASNLATDRGDEAPLVAQLGNRRFMQDSTRSFMQLTKTTASVQGLKCTRCPFVHLSTDKREIGGNERDRSPAHLVEKNCKSRRDGLS